LRTVGIAEIERVGETGNPKAPSKPAPSWAALAFYIEKVD
jgi:hypothetical protein